MKSSKRDNILVSLEVERSKLNREKSRLVLDKALMLYFSFLIVGVIGFINGFITARMLNMLVILSFGVLFIGILPYVMSMRKEEKYFDEMINSYKNRGGKNA